MARQRINKGEEERAALAGGQVGRPLTPEDAIDTAALWFTLLLPYRAPQNGQA